MENPFEVIIKRLESLEVQQAEILAALRVLLPATPNPARDKYVGTNEAAKLLGISKETLWKSKHKLNPVKRFGRLYFRLSELQTYLEEGTL